MIPFLLSVIPKQPYFLGQLGIVRHAYAPVAVASQVLARVEAETPYIADGPDLIALMLRSVSLAGVFDNLQTMLPGDLHDRIHVRRLPVQMHWNDGLCLFCYRFFYLYYVNIK